MSREQTLVRRVGYSKPIMGILASQDTREVVGLSNNMIDKAYNLSPGLSTPGDDCPGLIGAGELTGDVQRDYSFMVFQQLPI